MKKNHPKSRAFIARTKLPLISSLIAATAATGMADQVPITAYDGNSVLTQPPTYVQTIGTWSGSGSGSHSMADNAGKSSFGSGGTPAVRITPHLQFAGGVYTVEITYTTSSNTGTNLVIAVTSPDGDLSFTNTDGFTSRTSHVKGADQWYTLGYITNHPGVTDPAITFSYVSGAISGTARFWTDGYRFTYAGDPCINVPQLSTVNGPLAAGQTNVSVPGIANTATNISIYADSGAGGQVGGTLIGSMTISNVTSVVVPVTALIQGNFITAVQTISNVQACAQGVAAGQIVGAGPNSNLRFNFSLARDASLTGPAGAPANSSSTDLYFLGATSKVNAGAVGGAPVSGTEITPSTCWQTISLQNGVDPDYVYGGGAAAQDTNPFAALNSIDIAIDDLTDSGPYDIYIDDLKNGNVVIDDFETSSNGSFNAGFLSPKDSAFVLGFTTATYLLAQVPGTPSPNIAQVSTNHACTGNKSFEVSWQFKNVNRADWVHLNLANAPQVDLSQPISFRVLVLPVGVTSGDSRVSAIPSQTNSVGSTANFAVTAAGNSPFSYQWYDSTGNPISGATASSYARPSLTTNDAGIYTAVVMDANGCTNAANAKLVVSNSVIPVAINIQYNGTQAVLNWAGSHTLQSSTDAAGVAVPYTDVSGGTVLTGPYNVTPSGKATYYRLKN